MELHKRIREPIWWAFGTMIIGMLGLSGWIVHSRTLVTIFPEGITMAPISAFLFMLLGICLILTSQEMRDSRYTLVRDILLIPPLLIGIWVIFDIITGTPAHIDWEVYPPDNMFWMAPESSISPVSALMFIGLAIGIFGNRRFSRLAFWISLIIIITGAILILGYLSGTPLLYGGTIKPVSFLSACGFLLGGSGLLMCIRSNSSE